MHCDCIIIGGGAGGLAAAAALAPSGLRIAVIERLDRVGKKLLSTGNGRCNLSNEDMNPAYYGSAAGFVSRLYERMPSKSVLSFFSSLGLMTASEDGRIYPRTMAASSVLDVLRARLEEPNIAVLTGTQALSLTPSRRGGFSVQLSSGEGLFAPVVLMASGGCAAPNMGTDGQGFSLLESLGHSVSALHPALVQLRCDHGALRSLKGIRTHAALTLEIDRCAAANETGELLFADYGVSGVCVFQLSRLVGPAIAQKKHVRLLINLLPEVSDAGAWLRTRIASLGSRSAASLFTGVFPRMLTQAILRQANVAQEADASSLSAQELDAIAKAVCAFPLPVTGTQGFASAQVTHGGVLLDEVNPQDMSSRLFDGLYLCGELLDVDGPCGGYNLHFAFAGALCAAEAIRARLGA